MVSVAIYHKSVPSGNKNLEKPLILSNFSQGVRQAGDTAIDVWDHRCVAADVGVIQGWIQASTGTPHLKLRSLAIQHHPNVVSADSNLFLYKDKSNPGNYLRYSFNGIFPTTGIYCDDKVDPARWQQIKRDLKLDVKDYRTNGHYIVLCLQRNGGWSMAGLDVVTWTTDTINTIRRYTRRPILIRAHPSDNSSKYYMRNFINMPGVEISQPGRTLEQDLVNAWAVVNYNSSSVVGAAIEGYPVFVTDPARSQCRDIANTDLSKIETPELKDRQHWLERISMFHWKFEELVNGSCWNHMRQWIKF